MSVEVIHKVLLHPFVKESVNTLSSMTKFHGKAGDYFADNVDDFRFKGYAVCSEIHGKLEATILMHHYEETALAIGAQVYEGLAGSPATNKDSLNEDLANALAEWGNTIIGRAGDFLAKHNLGFKFDAPQMVLNLDDMEKYLEGVSSIVTVPIHIENVGRYYFNLLIRSVDEGGESEAVVDDVKNNIRPLDAPLSKDAKILLVDDSPLIRKALMRYLSKLGYSNFIEAEDGSEAVTKVATQSPDFVFMDIVMKQMNGDKALEKIRQSNKRTPIVMLTSVTDSRVLNHCESLGIQGIVLKPLNNETAPTVLSQCLGLNNTDI